ncbi:uncharacterized protein LOC113036809 [Astatotilapia calliptera]|uniref:uncharacterized protein LOC113036809 n=1 Tax=Astatotilapia calliptera TaxID=8154 RepID=UPI000E4018C1|nr:uncharacterized protein LOC113036809 [Astatotilapia calliptera]XP_026049108.1 uncharacterized protein LOC113036809 [Astatotilapia calliptera]XP_026049109.1 uncharacterized protein LOC113036809 [Astatotilapia calliptera]XP_026049110.1 uncharacterized protein LOC113036809 [Astatotilapia calliptera]
MAGRGQDSFNLFTPVAGRGWRLSGADEVRDRSIMSRDEPAESDDIIRNKAHERQSSTPALSDDSTHKELRELIGELGTQIGESIASRLLSSQVPLGPNQTAPAESPKVKSPDTTLDLSKVNLVVRQDIKDPPMYRGDDADKYSVHEWIDMMEVSLEKRGLSRAVQVDEVLNHLLGRAKNIVKVGLKSNSCSGVVTNPETIYAILRRYFSDSPGSCQPLADFYATQAVAKETPVDYWVRLNIAAEAADKHLQRQGGKMENMEAEIAMMFIRNCPDPSLACVFKCKPISKWTVMEVQEAIDEHQRECHAKKKSLGSARPHPLLVATATTTSESPEFELNHAQVGTVKCSQDSPGKAAGAAASDPSALDRVLSMLERVLERSNQPVHPVIRPQPLASARFPSCQVCGNSSHSTRTHCMRERRCLGCLEVGHQRKDCPRAAEPITQQNNPQGN